MGRSVGALRDVPLAPPCAAVPDTQGRVRVGSGGGVVGRGRPSEGAAGAAGPAVTPLPHPLAGELALLAWERRGRGYERARGVGMEPVAGGSGVAGPPGRAAPPAAPEPGSARADGTGRERWRAANFVLGGVREPPPPRPSEGLRDRDPLRFGSAVASAGSRSPCSAWPLASSHGCGGSRVCSLGTAGWIPDGCWLGQDEGRSAVSCKSRCHPASGCRPGVLGA